MESLQILFFGMERYTFFETVLDFTVSLSNRNCKVLSKRSREMFSLRKSYTKLRTSYIPLFIF